MSGAGLRPGRTAGSKYGGRVQRARHAEGIWSEFGHVPINVGRRSVG